MGHLASFHPNEARSPSLSPGCYDRLYIAMAHRRPLHKLGEGERAFLEPWRKRWTGLFHWANLREPRCFNTVPRLCTDFGGRRGKKRGKQTEIFLTHRPWDTSLHSCFWLDHDRTPAVILSESRLSWLYQVCVWKCLFNGFIILKRLREYFHPAVPMPNFSRYKESGTFQKFRKL